MRLAATVIVVGLLGLSVVAVFVGHAVGQAAQAVTATLEYGRAVHLGDLQRTQELHLVLTRLVTQLRYGAVSPTAAAEAANRGIEQVLARL